jgi:hypothetical protein
LGSEFAAPGSDRSLPFGAPQPMDCTMPRSILLAVSVLASACSTTTHQLVPASRSPEGAIYVAETTANWPFWFLGSSAVLRCRESAGSRTTCTRLRFVVTDQLTPEDCKESSNCADAGKCTLRDNACVAATAADCRASSGCAANGHCTAVDGRCAAGSAEDCAGSQRCFRFGQCSYNGQYCIAAADADCGVSMVCREAGQCSAVDGKCLAGKDADCAQSTACKSGGRCAARDGACVAAGKAAGAGKGP